MFLRRTAVWLLLGVSAWGEVPVPRPVAHVVDRRQGFTGSYPSVMIEDSQGRLWVGADAGGLFVGDGLRFLKVSLPTELAGMPILGLGSDHAGRVAVLTPRGLGILDHGAWRVHGDIRTDLGMKLPRFNRIIEHPSGTLLVISDDQAYRIEPGAAPRPMALPGSRAEGVPRVAWQGNQVVARRAGHFWRQEGTDWVSLPDLALPGKAERPEAFLSDGDGHLYLLTRRQLFHLGPAAQAWDALPFTPSPDWPNRMTRLGDGRIWILQEGVALTAFRGGLMRHPIPPDLATYEAEARCVDAEGNLWIGAADLLRLPRLGVVRVHAGRGAPPAKIVWKQIRDGAGRLWAGSGAGVYILEAEHWRALPGVSSGESLALGPDGAVYLRSQQQLLRVDPRTLRIQNLPIPGVSSKAGILRGPFNSGARMWVRDVRGRLLQGSLGKSGWAWNPVPLPTEGFTPAARLSVDETGRLWIWQDDRTFCREGDHWEELPPVGGEGLMGFSFRTPDSGYGVLLNPPGLLALRRTPGGWKAETVLRADQLNGLGYIYTIRQEPLGTLWLGTDRGVVRLQVDQPLVQQRYGMELGLPSEDTAEEGLLVEGTDRVWVGTAAGLAELRLKGGPAAPPMAAPSILEVRCGAWAVQGPSSTLTVRYRQGSVVWELGYPGPVRGEAARFEFREAEGPWEPLAGSALQFPEISPGHHQYEVRARSFLGEYGPSRRLDIHVLPPWYRLPVAYGAWTLLFAGSVVLGVRWRMGLLRRRNRELRIAVDRATEGLRAREQELEALNLRLYRINDTKNRVIAMAAHDLRNPLAGILLSSELIKEEEGAELLESAEQIRTLGQSMSDMIQRLLDIHAIEAGHAEAPRLAPMDLSEAMEAAQQRAQWGFAKKGIRLLIESRPPARVQADAAQVGQILDNLLSNAQKYSPAGTTVRLRVVEAERRWRVEVEDQGPGLTSEDLTRVFGEYARLSAKPTAGEPSVGLGLSLVKRLSEAMGGRVGVESRPDQGATFWLELPMA
ncbi:hypothetical protein GETHLI_11380 [Geothrix limicola]|uniref:histidine kinase n=1 Tax=Geothrix limicola TaxID=2927978 RepID=A0ABQ5QDY1_9BACT|nr:ATP-binding protein [Geothrix limicola]GLH72636.1 hypothetical protein GETHLI_11380 [Geothrix limicola]